MKNNFSFIWKFLEKFALTFFSFVCSMILARLVSPSDYGEYAIISSVILVLSTFVTNNIINLIVKEKELDDNKFSSILFYNFSLACILTLLINVVAYFMHNVYLSVQSINILIMAVQSVFMGVLVKRMDFKKIAKAALISGLTSFVVAIIMGKYNLGIYALIAQYTVNNLLLLILLGVSAKTKIKVVFNLRYIKENISFIFSVVVADVVQLLSRTVQNVIVKNNNSSAVLGYYDKGYTLSRTCSDMFYETFNSVTFPILSSHQDNNEKLRRIIKSILYVYTLLSIPVIIIFWICGDEIITILFSDVWKESAYYFKMFFIIYTVVSINVIASQCLVIKNNYKVYRNLTLIFNVVCIIMMILLSKLGAVYMPIIMLGCVTINYIVSLMYIKETIGYGIKEYVVSCNVIYIFGIITLVLYEIMDMSFIIKIGYILIFVVIYALIIYTFDKKKIIEAYHQLLKSEV